MSADAILVAYVLGSATLSLWVVARFPSLGPRTLTSAILTVAAVFVLQTPLLALMRPVGSIAGVAGALLLVVLPGLTLVFWSTARLVRTLVALVAPFRH